VSATRLAKAWAQALAGLLAQARLRLVVPDVEFVDPESLTALRLLHRTAATDLDLVVAVRRRPNTTHGAASRAAARMLEPWADRVLDADDDVGPAPSVSAPLLDPLDRRSTSTHGKRCRLPRRLPRVPAS
jgi:hypothetical protein